MDDKASSIKVTDIPVGPGEFADINAPADFLVRASSLMVAYFLGQPSRVGFQSGLCDDGQIAVMVKIGSHSFPFHESEVERLCKVLESQISKCPTDILDEYSTLIMTFRRCVEKAKEAISERSAAGDEDIKARLKVATNG